MKNWKCLIFCYTVPLNVYPSVNTFGVYSKVKMTINRYVFIKMHKNGEKMLK